MSGMVCCTKPDDDDDDLDPVAAFEDAHDELQSVDEDERNEAAARALDEQPVCSTDSNEVAREADSGENLHAVDELSDFHDPADAEPSDVHVSDAADGATDAPSDSSGVVESNKSVVETTMASEPMDAMTTSSAEVETTALSDVTVASDDDDVEHNAELDSESHEPLPDSSVGASAPSSTLETPHEESALDAAATTIEVSSVDDINRADLNDLDEAESPDDAFVESAGDSVGSLPLRSASQESDISSNGADPLIYAPTRASDSNDVQNSSSSDDSELQTAAVEAHAPTEAVASDETPSEPTAPFAAQEEHQQETKQHDQADASGTQDAVADDAPATTSDSDDSTPMPAPPLPDDGASDAAVLPPPAPTVLTVVVGSMIPSADDDDDDSDSQDDEDDDANERAAPPSPLHITGDDDDEDVLEVDAAVVETIQVEKQDAVPPLARATRTKDESALLAALPPAPKSLASSTDEIEFSFTDEIRVAHVTVPPTAVADAFEFKQKQPPLAPQDTDSSTVDAFGISYTSLKAKTKTSRSDGTDTSNSDTYALPTALAFPDEREFERELALSSDLAFSVKSSMRSDVAPAAATQNNDNGEDEDDEFSAVTAFDANEFSVDALEAKRASFEARTTEDEARVLQELKRATDAEKALNDAAATAPLDAPSASALSAPEPESAMSLRELHGIYKRGLGDQSVLLLDGDDNGSGESTSRDTKANKASTTSSSSGASGTPLSVMGRILSKPSLTTHAITEEADDDEDDEDGDGDKKRVSDDYGGTHDPRRERETLIDNGGARNSSDRGSTSNGDEWKEIQLVTHSATAASSTSSLSTAATASFRISYAEALSHCLEDDVFLLQCDAIVPEEFAETGRSCFACLSPRPRLTFAGALDERDRVFCIAATSYAPQSDVFPRVLQTLYTKLTRTQRAVPLSGSHWEDIGFQGNDPSTDLRGCGVLSLLQMLYLVETFPELALRAQSLAQHPTRHFPLACVLINVTLQCITALRTGALYKECNKQASVIRAINTVRL